MINKEDLSFTPDQDEVLGVFGNDVHVQIGIISEDAESETPVILVIPREEYFRAWNLWLDTKKEFCERYEQYCGAFGNIHVEECIKLEDVVASVYDEDSETEVDVQIEVYKVSKFGDYVNMEAG